MMIQVGLICLCLSLVACQTPLDDYVRRPDESYTWEKIGEVRDDENGITIHQLNMTSHTWRTEEEVSKSVWWHFMAVVVPDVIQYTEHTFLMIGENMNMAEPPTPDNDYFLGLVVNFVLETGAVGGIINHIPNQPIRFASDPKEEDRREDHIIAYTWREFLDANGTNPDDVVLFPMVKAAVRGMDTLQVFAEEELGLVFDHIFLTGASKRGWTTFLAAAVDPVDRIIAIAPMVFSLLNAVENLHRHSMSLGGWSWAFNPYYREDLTYHLTEEVTDRLFQNIDPLVYKDRLTMPKLLVSASGDEFFLPHETRIFFDQLEGPTYLMMLENSQHFMAGHHARLIRNFAAFFNGIVQGYEFPQLSWTIDEDEDDSLIVFEANVDPFNITSWGATTTAQTGESRDFRLLIGPDPSPNLCLWGQTPVENITESEGPYRFLAMRSEPENGYRGLFINAKFDMPDGRVLELTSEVASVPGTFPYDRCEGDECYGEIV